MSLWCWFLYAGLFTKARTTTHVLNGGAVSFELETLLSGDSALGVSAGAGHFAVVTMKKQLYTWHQGVTPPSLPATVFPVSPPAGAFLAMWPGSTLPDLQGRVPGAATAIRVGSWVTATRPPVADPA